MDKILKSLKEAWVSVNESDNNSMFRNGYCLEWAFAYKKINGGTVRAFVEEEKDSDEDIWYPVGVAHAFVVHGKNVIDVDGVTSLEVIKSKLMVSSPEHRVSLFNGSEKDLIDNFGMDEDAYEHALSVISTPVTEGLVKVPTDYIRQWINSHYKEFLEKLKETLKNGYNTTIDDSLIVTSEYTGEKIEVYIEIQKNILRIGAGVPAFWYSPENRLITVNATSFAKINKKKSKEELISAIIHELTHALDVGFDKKKHNVSNQTDYMNSDVEFVAYSREYIDAIMHLSHEKRIVILDRLRFGKKLGIGNIDEFLGKLNPENKKKFVKELFKAISQQSDKPNA